MAKPGVIKAKSHSEWPSRGVSSRTPDLNRLEQISTCACCMSFLLLMMLAAASTISLGICYSQVCCILTRSRAGSKPQIGSHRQGARERSMRSLGVQILISHLIAKLKQSSYQAPAQLHLDHLLTCQHRELATMAEACSLASIED